MRIRQFESFEDLQHFWKHVSSVPGRAGGRKHYHEERYCLALYLLALGSHGLLTYPLAVRQTESPDFIIEWSSGETTGLEITRATEPWLQRARTAADKEYQRREAQEAARGKVPAPVAILLSKAGWAPDHAELEWCALVERAIERKVDKLLKYNLASSHELLIYDDTPLLGVNRSKVLAALRNWIRSHTRCATSFSRISIIMSVDVAYDVVGTTRVLPFINWSSPKISTAKQVKTFSERVEYAGQVAADRAVQQHTEMRQPVYFMDGRGRVVKRTFDGRRFEVRVDQDGVEVIVQELAHE